MAKTQVATTKPAPGKGTAVVSWKDKLAGYAQAASSVAAEAGAGGKFISTKAGQLTYAGSPVAGNKLDVIVIEQVLENAYYGSDYDPDSPSSPICFAFAREKADLRPHEKSSQPQHDNCQGCPMNEFGTADKGKGKACKNVMRLALLPAKPLDAESLKKSEVAYMRLPVTSVTGFAAYVTRLKGMHDLPPFCFVTQISTQPDAKTQFKVLFQDVAKLDDDDVMPVLIDRHEGQVEAIMFPYQAPAEVEKPAAKQPARKKKY